MHNAAAPSGPQRLEYMDFELQISRDKGRRYLVEVLHSPGGEAQEAVRLPFEDKDFQIRLRDLQISLLRFSRDVQRKALSPDEATVESFGTRLFESVFSGGVRSRYDMSLSEARRAGKGLRVKLRVQPPELAVLPWEFLYDPAAAEYLCLMRNTPVVRYLEVAQPVQPLTVTAPLRILGMIASPRDLAPLDVAREKRMMEDAVGPLAERGLIELTWLPGQTWRDVQRAMRAGPWHVFHFIGHGDFDRAADEGAIALLNESGDAHLLRATELSRWLADHASLRLVVLNSCEGARGSDQDIFSSTASILVRRGIPAVLAMQYAISDRVAIDFSRAFYEAISDGWPVDAAVTEARKAVSMESDIEWGTPALYMHCPDGNLFSVHHPEAPAPLVTAAPVASVPTGAAVPPVGAQPGSAPTGLQEKADHAPAGMLERLAGLVRQVRRAQSLVAIAGIAVAVILMTIVLRSLWAPTGSESGPTPTITARPATASPTVASSETLGLAAAPGLGAPAAPTPSLSRTPTAMPTLTGTPSPPPPTPPLPGAVEVVVPLDPGWNFIALPLNPVATFSAASLQLEINNQIRSQGSNASSISMWDGLRIVPYGGNISLGVGYFVNITGANRVAWRMVGYPLDRPVQLSLPPNQKVSISIPYMSGTSKNADHVRDEINALGGGGAFVRLWKMIDTQGNWASYPDQIPSFTLESSSGYLLEVSKPVAWSPWQTIAPTSTPTAGPVGKQPWFGPISFCLELGTADRCKSPTTRLPAKTTIFYVSWEFANIPDKAYHVRNWYYNGSPLKTVEETWVEQSPTGVKSTFYNYNAGFDNGEYRLDLLINGQLLSSGTVIIGP